MYSVPRHCLDKNSPGIRETAVFNTSFYTDVFFLHLHIHIQKLHNNIFLLFRVYATTWFYVMPCLYFLYPTRGAGVTGATVIQLITMTINDIRRHQLIIIDEKRLFLNAK